VRQERIVRKSFAHASPAADFATSLKGMTEDIAKAFKEGGKAVNKSPLNVTVFSKKPHHL